MPLSYIILLRLPYQLQLGPIFGWGYLLAGGRLTSWPEVLRFTVVFLLFHICAFGGLTALNSYYDRDTGPIGGLWQPPPPPTRLWAFAWGVQIAGCILLLPLDWRLAAIYTSIVLLALGYSHPRTRWKGHPWKSLVVVAVGQGVLDFAAGAFTVEAMKWTTPTWFGLLGATLTVIGYYPLTQLYQVSDDTQRGDETVAAALCKRYGRKALFSVVMLVLFAGGLCNGAALWLANHPVEAGALFLGNLAPLLYIAHWRRDAASAPRDDFLRVHRLMQLTALCFGAYILARLISGGI